MPGDAEERRRALESRNNLTITAGAGTGKTYLLVEKICRKVIGEKMDVRRILALTFTEKAAQEMRERIREKLEEHGKVEGFDRAEIGTIHGFCAHVLREFPIEAGVAPDFRADEGTAFRRLFEREWPRWLDAELGAAGRRPRQWREVLEKITLDELRGLAWEMASSEVPADREDPESTLRRFVESASVEVPELAAALAGKKAPPRQAPKGAAPGFKNVLNLVKDMQAVDTPLVARALALVSDFTADFRRGFLARGWVSFQGMLALTHDLLRSREFPDVLASLREKYRYILVDEFQDTDPLQGEIIQRLAEGPDGKLVPGKLFLVGDPKQSIYSFRGADIIAYSTLAKRILDEGGESIVLRTNFRSHGGILDLVNAVFSKAIVEHGLLQPRYEAIEPKADRVPHLPGPHVEMVLVEGAKADESRSVEADAIARWILDRKIEHRKVAILFRALTSVHVYLEALRSRGIPYVVQGEKHFYGTSEVVDFINILRAVANPHDRIAVAGVLRSPFGALPDQELYDRRKALEPRADSEVPMLRFLHRWREQAGRMSVPDVIDMIFRESYALEIARAGFHGEQAVANLLKLRRKAAELEAQGGCTLREFVDEARQAVRELEEEGESPLADETLDAVRIMSIHSAKGLQFPVVILPDLHRRKWSGTEKGVRYDWPTRTLGVRLKEVCDAGGAALAYLNRERQREEDRRLLYVAVTRAEDVLVMLGSAEYEKDTHLALLFEESEKRARVTRRPFHPLRLPPPPPPKEKEKPDWEAFVALWREREKRAAPVERITSPSRLEREDDEAPVAPSRAIEVGVACHAVMEQLDFKSPRVPEGADREVAEIMEGFFKSAEFRGLAESEILARELPFVYKRGEQILEGVIDVVYRRDGKLFVADYKTDKIVEPGDYALIRELYSEAVRRVFGEGPGFRLIYLRHGKGVDS